VRQGLDEYEQKEEDREFLKAIAQGLIDICSPFLIIFKLWLKTQKLAE